MVEWYTKILDHILSGPNFIGLVCYGGFTITITWVHLHFAKQVVDGLKGENGKWESPEWLVYLVSWVFPHMLMASGFLKVDWPDWAWYTLWILVIFGLTGRWGLEWLLAFKGSKTTMVQETEIKQTTISTQTDEPEPKLP